MKAKFRNILQATGRDGVGNVLAELDELGFYEAPASTRFHGVHSGGLLQHSLNVYDEAMGIREVQLRLNPNIGARLPLDSIAITALLHDVCKAEIYKSQQKWKRTILDNGSPTTDMPWTIRHFRSGMARSP